MSVLVETSKGDLVIDLHVDVAPRACENFLKLCKLKYYNGCLFHHVSKGRLVQTGDPTGTGAGGTSVWGLLHGERARFFDDELSKRLNHASVGTVSMATAGPNTNASQFVITTGPAMHRLDESHTIFGRVAEGLEALAAIDAAYVDADGRPYQNVRIKHTIILDDPFPDPAGLRPPDRSPSPTPEQLAQDRARLADDEALDEHEGKTAEELEEALAAQAAKSRAEVLEMLGDLPDADVAPPDNVLFVCKLNAVTQDDDLEIIFARFGDIVKCEVIRDAKTGESLNYAFVEFAHKEQCEAAYLKMDGALIDDRRIKVDFSQSVAKVWNRYRRNEPMAAMGGAGPGGGGGVGGGGSRKTGGRTQLYEDGERARYFADDDEHGLAELYGVAKCSSGARGGAGDTDTMLADAITSSKRFKALSADDEWEHDDGAGMLEARRGHKARRGEGGAGASSAWGAPGGAGLSVLAERAQQRVAKLRPLIIALGNFAYVRVPEGAPLAPGHCVLEPLGHEVASTMASDEAYDELRNFKKCLIQMYAQRGQAAVFLEVAVALATQRRCLSIEAVPLPLADFAAAPAFFKKALHEAGSEWATHKQLIDTSGKGIRKSIPANFAYFHVEFGLDKGFAHVIEDESAFPLDFGMQVLEGVLEADEAGIPLHARRKLGFDAQKRNVLAFAKEFEPFDWTKMLRDAEAA